MQSTDRGGARGYLVAGALGALLAAGVVAYPYLLEAALPRFGASKVAVALLFAVAVSAALRGRSGVGALRGAAAPSIGIPILLAAAAASGKDLFLQLVPSAVYLTLASWFYASLSSGDSIVERAARYLVPEAPDFIRSYCRKLTGLWVAFFAASAVALACLAIAGARSAWAFATGKGIYALMLAASAVEFLVRKTWFRYYFRGGWFDRLWSRLFPAENTPEGRRSMRHIAEYWRGQRERTQ